MSPYSIWQLWVESFEQALWVMKSHHFEHFINVNDRLLINPTVLQPFLYYFLTPWDPRDRPTLLSFRSSSRFSFSARVKTQISWETRPKPKKSIGTNHVILSFNILNELLYADIIGDVANHILFSTQLLCCSSVALYNWQRFCIWLWFLYFQLAPLCQIHEFAS